MRIIFDLDDCLFYPKYKLARQASRAIIRKKIPWPIILLGLLAVRQESDKEMIEIINNLSFSEKIIFTSRPNKNLVKKFTLKFLEKRKVNIDVLECLGGGPNCVEIKEEWAIQRRVDLVVVNDEVVRKIFLEKGIPACSPELFKKFYNIGVIR